MPSRSSGSVKTAGGAEPSAGAKPPLAFRLGLPARLRRGCRLKRAGVAWERHHGINARRKDPAAVHRRGRLAIGNRRRRIERVIALQARRKGCAHGCDGPTPVRREHLGFRQHPAPRGRPRGITRLFAPPHGGAQPIQLLLGLRVGPEQRRAALHTALEEVVLAGLIDAVEEGPERVELLC